MRERAVTAEDFAVGLGCYYLSGLLTLFGTLFGVDFVRTRGEPDPVPMRVALCRADGQHYKSICESGYAYDPDQRSQVAFFPAYPVLARGVVAVTGCGTEWALLIVAHLALVTSFVGLHAYVRLRCGADSPRVPARALLAFGLVPTGFFMRMCYSESLFVLAVVAVLLAVRLRCRFVTMAALCGLATAVRPVGVAVVPLFLWSVWVGSATMRGALARAACLAPLSCWGLLAYMGYQYWEFGDALAFAKTQTYWRARDDAPWGEKFGSLARLEPARELFDPVSPRYWQAIEWHDDPLFSLVVANPIVMGLFAGLIALGAARRWLNGGEVLLGAGLLAIPYVTRGYDNAMLSAGRFATVALPAYLVLGQLIARCPGWAVAHLAALAGFFLAAYAALFAAGWLVF